MNIKTVSSKEFHQNVSGVKKASANGPVFITYRGEPAHVLLTIDEYRKLTSGHRDARPPNILELLAMPGVGEIDFEPPRLEGSSLRVPDFSE